MLNEDKSEAVVQYQMLRAEILGNDTLVMQVIGFTFAFVGVALAVSVQFGTSLPLIASLMMLTLVNTYITRLRANTWRIASYLRMAVEPGIRHVKWETRLCRFRALPPPPGKWPALTYA